MGTMSRKTVSPAFLKKLEEVTGKRPRAVIDHILKHGSVTTEDLAAMGYEHAPRAARDVRELGIPLVTKRVPGKSGRSIAAYEFGDPKDLQAGLQGRTPISKKFKNQLIDRYGSTCMLCNGNFDSRYLQPDHRIPVEIAGDTEDDARDVADYMPSCSSCNRAKSWSCENCVNTDEKKRDICATCYWALPDGDYAHVATEQIRRLDVVWQGAEIEVFERLVAGAKRANKSLSDHLKTLIKLAL